MPNVSITQFVNGTTADASVVDSNLNAIAAVLNGGIDPTNITAASLTEATLVSSLRPSTFLPYITKPFVVSGMTIATSANLSTTIASGTALINGKVVTFASTPLTVVLSKDTYIDIKDDGSVVQVAVANNATVGMTLTTNSDGSNALRIAKVVSSGTAITSVTQTGTDSLNNLIYNLTPVQGAGSWLSWTPTFTNFTPGNSVVNARYQQIGKTVHINMTISLGSTSSMGSGINFTLPVTASSNYTFDQVNGTVLGSVSYLQLSTAEAWGPLRLNSNTVAQLMVLNAAGTYVSVAGVSATAPFTFAPGNQIFVSLVYEAL